METDLVDMIKQIVLLNMGRSVKMALPSGASFYVSAATCPH